MSDPIQRIGIIGFGEAGSIFARDLAAAGIEVSIFDFRLLEKQTREAMFEKARDANVRACERLEDVVEGRDLVISSVTASAAIDVARQTAAFLRKGQVFLDTNSVSPETKGAIALEIERSGGDFVEAAVMGALPSQRLKVPMLLGGVRAADLAPRLRSIGMDATAVSERIGVASAIKMCRSVIMKGLGALVIESLFTARRYGAEAAVLASLDATFPQMGWSQRFPDNLIFRTAEHSRRRAAEMREVTQTLKRSGVDPLMSSAIAELHDWLADEMEALHLARGADAPFDWRALADTIRAESKSKGNIG